MDTGSGLMQIGNEPADGGHVFVGVYAPNKIEVVVCLIISVDMLLCTHCKLFNICIFFILLLTNRHFLYDSSVKFIIILIRFPFPCIGNRLKREILPRLNYQLLFQQMIPHGQTRESGGKSNLNIARSQNGGLLELNHFNINSLLLTGLKESLIYNYQT